MFVFLCEMTLSLCVVFRVKIQEPKDKQWGVRDKTGRWTGMMGQLVRKVTSHIYCLPDMPNSTEHGQPGQLRGLGLQCLKCLLFLSKEVDFAVSAFKMVKERADVAEYMRPFSGRSLSIAVGVPQRNVLRTYVEPFQVRAARGQTAELKALHFQTRGAPIARSVVQKTQLYTESQ